MSAYLGPQIGIDALGRTVFQGAIYDPMTTRTVTAGQVDPATGLTAAADATIRDPFPGNIIPSNRFDRVTKNVLPLFPEPSLPGILSNFGSQAIKINRVNGWGTKIDHALTDDHKLFGSFVWSRLSTPGESAFPGALSRAIPNTNDIRIFRLGEDSILRTNLINHAALGFNRLRFGTHPTADAFGWPLKIGLTGVNENAVFPRLDIAGQDSYGGTEIAYGAQNNFDVNESLIWIKGKHTLKFGFEYLKMMSNDVSRGQDTGSLSFNNPETALPGSQAGATGAGMASFLLGWADSGEVHVYASGSYERSGYYAGYAQDDFKVTPKFTLNMGLRYDLYRPTAFSIPDKFRFGNAPRTLGNARGFAYLNEDISIIKRTKVNERVSVDFRADFLNIFNRTVFGVGTGGDQYGSAINALFNSQANYPREIQFGLKINY